MAHKGTIFVLVLAFVLLIGWFFAADRIGKYYEKASPRWGAEQALAQVPTALGTVAHTAAAVGTVSAQVIGADPDRKLLILQNDSDTIIYCNLAGGAAVVNEGVRLAANIGNQLVLDRAVPVGAIRCIHGGSGNKTLLLTTGK